MCSPQPTCNERTDSYATYEDCVGFHGHSCPGLSSGYQVAVAAMKALGVGRPKDEELVAICETDACGVDAIQVITGCTAGKGNLIIHDYGKHAFTFYCRKTDRAVRVTTDLDEFMPGEEMSALRPKVFGGTATPEETEKFYSLMNKVSKAILKAPLDRVTRVEEITMTPPNKARIFQSIPCECCGEMVADAKTKEIDGKKVCIPCSLKNE